MKLGDVIWRQISYGEQGGRSLPPEPGVVVYIHPQRRFFSLEFTFDRHGIRRSFRESYPLANRITNPTAGSPPDENKFRPGPRGNVAQMEKKHKGAYSRENKYAPNLSNIRR